MSAPTLDSLLGGAGAGAGAVYFSHPHATWRTAPALVGQVIATPDQTWACPGSVPVGRTRGADSTIQAGWVGYLDRYPVVIEAEAVTATTCRVTRIMNHSDEVAMKIVHDLVRKSGRDAPPEVLVRIFDTPAAVVQFCTEVRHADLAACPDEERSFKRAVAALGACNDNCPYQLQMVFAMFPTAAVRDQIATSEFALMGKLFGASPTVSTLSHAPTAFWADDGAVAWFTRSYLPGCNCEGIPPYFFGLSGEKLGLSPANFAAIARALAAGKKSPAILAKMIPGQLTREDQIAVVSAGTYLNLPEGFFTADELRRIYRTWAEAPGSGCDLAQHQHAQSLGLLECPDFVRDALLARGLTYNDLSEEMKRRVPGALDLALTGQPTLLVFLDGLREDEFTRDRVKALISNDNGNEDVFYYLSELPAAVLKKYAKKIFAHVYRRGRAQGGCTYCVNNDSDSSDDDSSD